MCVAVPMKILSIDGVMAMADIGGVSREISLMMLPEAQLGDFVIVHAGFAIEKLDEEEALKTLELFQQMEYLPGMEGNGE